MQFFENAQLGIPYECFAHVIQIEGKSTESASKTRKFNKFPFKPVFTLTTVLKNDGRILQHLSQCRDDINWFFHTIMKILNFLKLFLMKLHIK